MLQTSKGSEYVCNSMIQRFIKSRFYCTQGSTEAPATGKNCFVLDLGAPAIQGKYTYIFLGQLGKDRDCRRLVEVFLQLLL